MAQFIFTSRGPINIDHVTHVTPPTTIRRDDSPTLESDIYRTDGGRVTLRGQEAQDVYDYFVYICLSINFMKAREKAAA